MTLDENTGSLWIRSQAVRKYAEHSTIPNIMGPDGHIYVHVDPETMAERRVPSDQHQRHSWLEYIAAGSGIVALLGIMTYGLGLFALWVPIWRTYSDGPATAWHAAALVPQTVVAGLGIGQLIGWPTLILLLYYLCYFGPQLAMDPVLKYARRRWGRRGSLVSFELIVLVIAGFWSGVWVIFFDAGLRTVVIIVAIFLALGNGGLILGFWRKRKRARSQNEPDQHEVEDAQKRYTAHSTQRGLSKENKDRQPGRWWWVWLLVGIVPYYASAAVSVALSEPALPTVDITSGKDTQSALLSEGALLTHADGFWYVFDVEGDNKGDLVAIREDQVETVTLSSESSSEGK